ncbi:Esterase/lipase superfamily enzyme [Paracoccus alcaliphilus]|uniref:Esterase/lipase superfamily enzyme n=2 Tax=Paracoccus alcaliphilus TaxID=34002 RepID=A0A1H8LX62_9RHOB|nr:Esterase/lipase superfamily enzyme [Paracoccus alcaliphilus]
MRTAAASLMICMAVLGACSARPGPDILAPAANMLSPDAETRVVRILTVTTRDRLADRPHAFGAGRAAQPGYASFDISIPPGHQPGQIEWPDGAPDRLTDFVTLRQTVMGEAAFLDAAAGSRVTVFVHGFNHSFQEALFRLAQMNADTHRDDTSVLFSWPSEGRVSAYLADRDSVDYSRQALVDLLTGLAGRAPPGQRVTVFAHSMGGRLTMEALRQLRLTGRDDVLDRLNVVLAAPDIDLDVFREQAVAIGPMQEPVTVLVASDDRALALSSYLSAGHGRAGTMDVSDPRLVQAVEQAGMRIVDISSVQTDGIAHSRYVDLMAIYPALQRSGAVTDDGLGLRRSGAFVFDAVGMTFQRLGGILAD